MKVEDMKGGYTTGSCATAGMKAGLLALLDKNIVDQVVIENPQGQYIEVPIKQVEVISDTEAKVTTWSTIFLSKRANKPAFIPAVAHEPVV